MANENEVDNGSEGEGSRGRSTIDFPYNDLADGEEVVIRLYNNAGTSCTVDQLAAYMSQAARGGGFRMKVSTAKTFGLIETPRGQIVLTDLGRRIVDPSMQAAARVEAFLGVGLFRKLNDKFRGNLLPPKPALTREIQNMGVIETQADRARQVFERSAEQAGFFAFGRDRLVAPVLAIEKETAKTSEADELPQKGARRAMEGVEYDPLIQGLLNRLPAPGEEWPSDARAMWIRALVTNFDLLYSDTTGKRVAVNVSEA